MNVILLDNVENLGSIGDLVKVKPGYGRNYLSPKGKAAVANAENVAALEARRAELEAKQRGELDAANAGGRARQSLVGRRLVLGPGAVDCDVAEDVVVEVAKARSALLRQNDDLAARLVLARPLERQVVDGERDLCVVVDVDQHRGDRSEERR